MPIFDQGYQHWKGHLSGHAWRWLAVTRHGVRIGMQGRVFRAVLLVSLLPAVCLATALCLWGLAERKSDLVRRSFNFSSVLRFSVRVSWTIRDITASRFGPCVTTSFSPSS